MGERPKITVVDDPLEAGAARTPRPSRPRTPAAAKEAASANGAGGPNRSAQRRSPTQATAPDLSAEALTGVFGRVPGSLARRLEGMVFQLRGERKTSQQDVLAALLLRFVDDADKRSVAEMHGLLDEYEKSRDPRRARATHTG